MQKRNGVTLKFLIEEIATILKDELVATFIVGERTLRIQFNNG